MRARRRAITRRTHHGQVHEIDINLVGPLVVQVKSGHARKVVPQLEAITAKTDRRPILYAPDISPTARFEILNRGIPVARTQDELLDIIEELT